MENDDIVQHLMRHEIPHDFRIIRNMVAALGLVVPLHVQHRPYSRVASAVRLPQSPILKQPSSHQQQQQQVAAVEEHEISGQDAAAPANRLSPSPPMTSSASSSNNNNNHHDHTDVTDSTNHAAAPRSVSFKTQPQPIHRNNNAAAHGPTVGLHHTGYNLIPFLALPCQLESHAVDDARHSQGHFQTLLAHIISDDAFLHSCFASGLNDDERQMYKLYEDTYKATEHAIQMAFVKTRWLQNPPTQTDDDNSLVLIGFQCALPNDRSELIKGVHMRLLRQLGLAGKFPHSNCVSESADALVKAIGKNLKKGATGDHSSEKGASHNRLSSLLHSTSAKSLLEKYKHEGCVLFIAESEQVNECTPLVIELEMRGIETFICSLKQFSTARTQLTVSVDGKLSYILPTMKDVTTKAVEMVVYADPYTGLRVDDPREWYDIRVIIEKSHAVTCPSARYLMASSTRILANLQKGNNMKQFLKSADLSTSVLNKLVEMVPLDVEEIGENYVQRYYHPITTVGGGNVNAGQHLLRHTANNNNNGNGSSNPALPSPTLTLDPSNATFIEKLDPIVESNVMVMPDTLRAGQVVPIVSMYGVMVTRKTYVVSSEVYDDVEVCGESAPCKFINLGLYECIEPRFVSSAVYNLHQATEKDTFGH